MYDGSFRQCLLAALLLSPAASTAADRCMQISDQLNVELEASLNRNARERAAIADLKRPYDGLAKKLQAKEITSAEYGAESSKWSKAEDCINAENHVRDAQAYYTHDLKLIEAKCRKGPAAEKDLRYEEKRREKMCGVVDMPTLASLMTQVAEIMGEKLAKEEPETAAVTQIDASLKQSEFCGQIRAIGAQAPTYFKSITGEKTGLMKESFGLPGTGMRELLQRDIYKTSVNLALDFLSSNASCEIAVGFNPVLVQRVPPTYSCTWSYDRIARKELEQKADRLFNVVRGCFTEVLETPIPVYRHSFAADKSVQVEGGAYFGEGKPSSISIAIRKYTPAADLARAMYLNSRKEADRTVCMQKHMR